MYQTIHADHEVRTLNPSCHAAPVRAECNHNAELIFEPSHLQ